MSRFIEGEKRSQATLLPELLDDYVTEKNPVRVIDVFVDELTAVAERGYYSGDEIKYCEEDNIKTSTHKVFIAGEITVGSQIISTSPKTLFNGSNIF